MKYQIKHRWTGAVLFEAELGAEYDGETNSVKMGAVVRLAIKAGADLGGAYLGGAYLRGAKWRGDITIQRATLFLYGLKWDVVILDEHMQIGCELHRLDEWAAFDDERIVQMDRGALKFWRAHKGALLALAAADGRGAEKAAA